MKHRFDAASGKLPGLLRLPRVRAPLTMMAPAVAVSAILASSGCGPIGLYSLVHSTLASHHVFKPVVADEPVNDGEVRMKHLSGPLTDATGKIGSSRAAAMPKVITRQSRAKAADAKSRG
jgi:hypothetical protein